MDLSEITNIVQIIGIALLIYGMWLGLKQLKLQRNQRRDLAIMECARPFEDKEFTNGYRLLSELKPGITKEELTALGEDYEIAAIRVGMKFETIGLLVFKGVVQIDAMQDLVGGAGLTIWNVIEKWVIETRLDRSQPTVWEW